MATSTPSRSSSRWSWRSKPATDNPSWSGNDPCWPPLVRTTSRWSTKSKSIWKLTWPWWRRRVVRPRTSRYRGTFHQWLRGAVAASLTLPTIWAHRCRVVLVGAQASSGSSGRSGRAAAVGVMARRTSSLFSVTAVEDEADLVEVAPAPVLARFHRPCDGMVVVAGVATGVAVGGGVAAADLTAGLTHALMDPPAAGLEALLAALDRTGWLGQVDLVQVGADGHGQASLIAAAKAAPSVASS